jgi:hypothetical protein
LPHAPNGKPWTSHLFVMILLFRMTFGTPLPSQLKLL